MFSCAFSRKPSWAILDVRSRSYPGPQATETQVSIPDDLLKIGEFAKLADTNLRTLRYYEELGLLQPAMRSEGGFRYYRPTDLNRVRMISDLQELGLQLDRISELLATRREGDTQVKWVKRVKQALNEQRQHIEERVIALAEQREQIDVALTKLDTCIICDHHPAADNNFCEPCQRTESSLPPFLSALF